MNPFGDWLPGINVGAAFGSILGGNSVYNKDVDVAPGLSPTQLLSGDALDSYYVKQALATPSTPRTGSSGSTGGNVLSSQYGGSGSYGSSAPVVDPTEVAYWNDNIGSLERLLQSAETQKSQGLDQIGNSYTQQLNRTNDAEGRAMRDYGVKRDDTTSARDRNIGQIDSNARNTNNSLARLLGLAGAGVSSAASILAPTAVARQATQQRTNTMDTYGRNLRDLDTAESDARVQFGNQRDDLASQKREKEQSFLRGILESQNDLSSQLANAVTQRGIAQGGNYSSTADARSRYVNDINSRRNALDALFGQYRDPQYSVRDVNVQKPELSGYTADAAKIRAQQSNPGVDASLLPYLAQLRKDERGLF